MSFATWPSDDVGVRTFALGHHSLTVAPTDAGPMTVRSPQTVGLGSGEYMPWFAFGPGPELPDDQRSDDNGSLVFDSEPLEIDRPVLGNPSLIVTVAGDAPQALLAVRLCDVAPNGASTLITRGLLNLSHRTSKSDPTPLKPGEPEHVTIDLDHVGYTIPQGHRLRLAISTTYWPMAWPAPTAVTLTIHPATSRLELPVWNGRTAGSSVDFDPAPPIPAGPVESISPHHEDRGQSVDASTGEHHLEIKTDNGRVRFTETGLEVDSESLQRYSIHPDDPLSARAHYFWRWRYRRDDWEVETTATTTMTCTESTFEVSAEITASESGRAVMRRTWDESYPRDHF